MASDRLLALIQKGVTVAQVARVTRNFTEAGILVHAYLMYGFPTQTAQETIDSLEMVRQMFAAGVLQSGFWHQFAMTAHSPVGLHPEQFGVQRANTETGRFANNDLVHLDPTGADHEQFSFGLKKSLLNYMHGIGLDFPLRDWFEVNVPRTSVPPDFIARALQETDGQHLKPSTKLVWLGGPPVVRRFTKTKKDKQWEMVGLTIQDKRETAQINLDRAPGEWLAGLLPRLSVANAELRQLQDVRADFEAAGLEDFDFFWQSKPMNTLRTLGLLVL